jgi:anti-anti-sigma regulatory factor
MTIRNRTLVVEQLPEIVSMKQARAFLREIKSCMSIDCPRIVFDCSQVLQMNASLIYMLLCCLEETIKRNGDVKLAAMTPTARAILKLTGVNRVFEIYDTTPDAVNSFCQLRADRISPEAVTVRPPLRTGAHLERLRTFSFTRGQGSSQDRGGPNDNIGVLSAATDRS